MYLLQICVSVISLYNDRGKEELTDVPQLHADKLPANVCRACKIETIAGTATDSCSSDQPPDCPIHRLQQYEYTSSGLEPCPACGCCGKPTALRKYEAKATSCFPFWIEVRGSERQLYTIQSNHEV